MADQLYVNKPGGVIVHFKDGTSHNLSYGDPVPADEVADYVDVKTFADGQKRKPDAVELQVMESHRRAALAENGQVNSSSSPVPSNYSDLDEDGAAQLVANLEPYPDLQAAVIKHELAFGGNRQKVIDAASDYAKETAGLLIDGEPDTVKDPTGAALLDEPPVIPHPDPFLVQERLRAGQTAAGTTATPDDIDALSGKELDEAVEAAGIDASTGGSKSDGGLTADEKRTALRQAQGQLTPAPS